MTYPNRYQNTCDVVNGFIRHRDGRETVFVIDAEDLEKVGPYRWNISGDNRVQGYIPSVGLQSRVLLHRLLCETAGGLVVDHANRDPLDNRKSNLRVATRSQNTINSKTRVDNISCGFKGVSARGEKWRARAVINGERVHIGFFDTAELAFDAYVKLVRPVFGEFFNESLLKVEP